MGQTTKSGGVPQDKATAMWTGRALKRGKKNQKESPVPKQSGTGRTTVPNNFRNPPLTVNTLKREGRGTGTEHPTYKGGGER